MFPVEVQEQLGVVGPDSQGAVHLLEKIGLRFLRHVDPFDGGPFYGAKVKDLVLVQQFRRCRVKADTVEQGVEKGEDLLIGWESADGFRAARVRARCLAPTLSCPLEILSALELAEGTEVGVIPFI
jgi:arginine N-succinyltransferase